MNAQGSVVLDYTLHDLYNIENTTNEEFVLVYAYPPPADIEPSPSTPILKRFPIQSPLCPDYEKEELAKLLSNGTSQRLGFCSGPMPMTIFDPEHDDGPTPEQPSDLQSKYADLYNVFNQLPATQRPHPRFLKSPESLKLEGDSRLAVLVPLDWVSHYPHIIDPDVHYNLLSKRGLAHSELPTPKSIVIDTQLSPTHAFTELEIQEEVTRMTQPIREHALPFILKVPRAASIGQGTFIVRTENNRIAANAVFQDIVRRMLQDLTPCNAHLHPCNVVMQEMVHGETVGITFFVTQSGRAIFNCCTRQETDGSHCWSGGFVSYDEQLGLEEEYRDTINTVARFLHKHGYFGPAGVDIMKDHRGHHLVVDLNVRATGTYHLGPLKGHFVRKGLIEAAGLANQRLRCTREEFEKVFERQLREGRILVTAWVCVGEWSFATLTLAAEDLKGLKEVTREVAEFKERCWPQRN